MLPEEYMRSFRRPLKVPTMSVKKTTRKKLPATTPIQDAMADARELVAKINVGNAGLADVAEFQNRRSVNKLAWTAVKHLIKDRSNA